MADSPTVEKINVYNTVTGFNNISQASVSFSEAADPHESGPPLPTSVGLSDYDKRSPSSCRHPLKDARQRSSDSCEFTLDPNTANSYLSLSDGNRKVEFVKDSQSYPDHPERFDGCVQVLCRESLTGRCYWEAEWSGMVDIAVTYNSISRKGDSADCRFGWNVKSWILSCSDDSYSVYHNNNSTELSARPSSSETVGVYVDCPAGTLSFYSISSHTLTHLHTFSTTFTEPLCAGFTVWGLGSSVCLK
ncbi:stonustoxin subunit beta-like [Colossoma macropomum]|uniref:stonustoxin subunit beta-like n=1 Tax=Colossoma macropomum TaxID=42526 RepID=UPI00186484F5|nr:stonustoxin subunit beta-like [Colossoma macropomum]